MRSFDLVDDKRYGGFEHGDDVVAKVEPDGPELMVGMYLLCRLIVIPFAEGVYIIDKQLGRSFTERRDG